MSIHSYLEECLLLLTVLPAVEHFSVTNRRETETDGYFRARAILENGCLLEFLSERNPRGFAAGLASEYDKYFTLGMEESPELAPGSSNKHVYSISGG